MPSDMAAGRNLGRVDDVAVPDPDERTFVELTDEERLLLSRGLVEWGGPASCTDAVAVAMGFNGVEDLLVGRARLVGSLKAGEALSRWDWTRVLFATEIVFVSDVVGSGVDWHVTTGLDDGSTLRVLRGLQRKLAGIRTPLAQR